MTLPLPRRWFALLASAALLTLGFFAPAATYSVVTQSTIGSTICVSGWTATVRPPTSYTNALKVTQIAQYGYSDTSTADYEEDHLIPLELGGNPTSALNLWQIGRASCRERV